MLKNQVIVTEKHHIFLWGLTRPLDYPFPDVARCGAWRDSPPHTPHPLPPSPIPVLAPFWH